MTDKRRILALVTVVAFCLLVAFSSVYMMTQANHDCTGEHCPVCCQLHLCAQTLKLAFQVAAVAALALAAVCAGAVCLNGANAVCPRPTLTQLKVKLSN